MEAREINKKNKTAGIYIHIPFCVKKCNYCAFISTPAGEETIARYVDALIAEIKAARYPNYLDKPFISDFPPNDFLYNDFLYNDPLSISSAEIPNSNSVEGLVYNANLTEDLIACQNSTDDLIHNPDLTDDLIHNPNFLEDLIHNPHLTVDTIYFGGGTPSLLSPCQIERILDAVLDSFSIAEVCSQTATLHRDCSADAHPDALNRNHSADARRRVLNKIEITLEANPATLTLDKLKAYRQIGINRLSMGVQSFDDATLKYLGRIHDAETAVRDYELARKAGFENINLDLMFGIPVPVNASALTTALTEGIAASMDCDIAVSGLMNIQSDCKDRMSEKQKAAARHAYEKQMATLRRAIELDPEHISYYSLQLEENTKFWRDFEAGHFHEIPDELDREMYHSGIALLKDAGYEHYEISNFAKKNSERKPRMDISVSKPATKNISEDSCYISRHNSKYWNMSPYYGFGLAASSFLPIQHSALSTAEPTDDPTAEPTAEHSSQEYIAGKERFARTTNTADLNKYLAFFSSTNAEVPFLSGTKNAAENPRLCICEDCHINTIHDTISEAVFTGLRLTTGIRYSDILNLCKATQISQHDDAVNKAFTNYETSADRSLADFDDSADNSRANFKDSANWSLVDFDDSADAKAFFFDYYSDIIPSLHEYEKDGYLVIDDEGIRLTESGIDISNRIMTLFV